MNDLDLGSSASLSLLKGAGIRGEDLVGALVVVDEGWVAITSQAAPEARRMILALGGPGWLLPVGDNDERVEALTFSRVRLVHEELLSELLGDPATAGAVVEGLLQAIRDRQESLRWFANVKHVERVRGKLLQLARAHGRVSGRGIRIDLPLTHELLAAMVGSSRETVTAALADLQREGFVERLGRYYCLHVAPDELAS